MADSEPTTVILPVNLGDASKYDGDIFPLAYHHAGDKISKGGFLLSATLDEMIKISEMDIDLNTDKRFQYNAMIQYEMSGKVNIPPPVADIDALAVYQPGRQS
ncbi:hypothetical protein JVU11DRAFT_11057 [Chiua virens]|nr:hypothetical protein JVU11DRAFT_11057 [Chiua virens]